jgi:hypothetical protein
VWGANQIHPARLGPAHQRGRSAGGASARPPSRLPPPPLPPTPLLPLHASTVALITAWWQLVHRYGPGWGNFRIGYQSPSRFRPPGTVLGDQEIFPIVLHLVLHLEI